MREDMRPPEIPGDLRAGQLGLVLLGRVIMGDIAVTMVDLALRGLLDVKEAENSGDWLLRPLLASAPGHRGESLLGYEKRLLESLPDRGGAARLTTLGTALGAALPKARTALVREMVRQGWLQHMHHDLRTEAGAELTRRVRSFQRDLGRFRKQHGDDAVNGSLLPYALHFGIVSDDRMQLVRFAHSWVEAFKDLPGWQATAPKRSEFMVGDRDDAMARKIGRAVFLMGGFLSAPAATARSPPRSGGSDCSGGSTTRTRCRSYRYAANV